MENCSPIEMLAASTPRHKMILHNAKTNRIGWHAICSFYPHCHCGSHLPSVGVIHQFYLNKSGLFVSNHIINKKRFSCQLEPIFSLNPMVHFRIAGIPRTPYSQNQIEQANKIGQNRENTFQRRFIRISHLLF